MTFRHVILFALFASPLTAQPRASKKRCHASMPRLPPQEGLPPSLCIPPLAISVGALCTEKRTFHLLIKADILTCYQQSRHRAKAATAA